MRTPPSNESKTEHVTNGCLASVNTLKCFGNFSQGGYHETKLEPRQRGYTVK